MSAVCTKFYKVYARCILSAKEQLCVLKFSRWDILLLILRLFAFFPYTYSRWFVSFFENCLKVHKIQIKGYYSCSSASISSNIFFLAHSGQMMSASSWMNPLPTMEFLQMAQKKHSLCQAIVSKATNRVLPSPPLPVMGFEHAVHLFEKSSPKHSAQNGLSSLEVNLWPARDFWQWVQVKHSRCHGSLR